MLQDPQQPLHSWNDQQHLRGRVEEREPDYCSDYRGFMTGLKGPNTNDIKKKKNLKMKLEIQNISQTSTEYHEDYKFLETSLKPSPWGTHHIELV